MPTEQPTTTAFADNWAYLKTELAWLDRVLMVAVSRLRKEEKGIERVAQSAADRVSRHWWQGVVSLEGKIAYDEHRPQNKGEVAAQRGRYQQQLAAKIAASQAEGIFLALPELSDRLQLPLFEKNLVLMALAPEVNRRYGEIYQFLQGETETAGSDLPTVDLGLRLLCRNDREWCTARQHLFTQSVLSQQGLLDLVPRDSYTTLNWRVRLSPRLLNFLLADIPTPAALAGPLRSPIVSLPAQASAPGTAQALPGLLRRFPTTDWSALVLPAARMQQLQAIAQTTEQGASVLFAGAVGTGKTLAAEAIAHARQQSLVVTDLAQMQPQQFPQAWNQLTAQTAPVLLVRQAEHWLRRSATINAGALQRWLQERDAAGALTLLAVTHAEAVAVRWQQCWAQVCLFPAPTVGDRQILWERAFPDDVPQDKGIDWAAVARCAPLTGGEIRAIAKTALHHWQKSGDAKLSVDHLNRALQASPASAIRHIPRLQPKKRKAARQSKSARQSASS